MAKAFDYIYLNLFVVLLPDQKSHHFKVYEFLVSTHLVIENWSGGTRQSGWHPEDYKKGLSVSAGLSAICRKKHTTVHDK